MNVCWQNEYHKNAFHRVVPHWRFIHTLMIDLQNTGGYFKYTGYQIGEVLREVGVDKDSGPNQLHVNILLF